MGCDCGCTSGTAGIRGHTRALKNARFLQATAPEVFAKDERAKGFGTGIPLDILRQVHRLRPDAPILSDYPDVREFLKTKRPPVPNAANPARTGLFSGTVYFAQVTFNTSSGTNVMTDADMQTIVEYAQHAIVPISEYAVAQYGATTVAVSSQILKFSTTVSSGTFTDGDLRGWVKSMTQQNGLSSDSCIYVICPEGISASEVGGNAGYHNFSNNMPYIVAGVYSTGLTLQDEADVYAMVVSHEMAEMVVDPTAQAGNPEVCDPCDINCGNLTRVYFDSADNYLAVNQDSPPGGVAYEYYICAIVKSEGASNCPASAADCQYAPVSRFMEFVMGQNSFSKDEVDSTPAFTPAFWLRVSGVTSESLNLTGPGAAGDPTGSPPVTIDVSVEAALNTSNGLTSDQLTTISSNLPSVTFGPDPVLPTDPTFVQDPQAILYPYSVSFPNTLAFGALLPNQSVFVTVNATLTVGQLTLSAAANIVLSAAEDPRFENVNPSNPTAFPDWLSFDLRFFKMTVPSTGATQTSNLFGATMSRNPVDAPAFIASVLTNLNSGSVSDGNPNNTSQIPSDAAFEALSQDEDASSLEFLPNDDHGNYVFNFALARVRLKGNTAGAMAKKVRVFFRLFQAQSTVSNFDPSTTYRTFSDGQLNGRAVPLLGVQNDKNGNPEYVTAPCFASPRVNFNAGTNTYVPVNMNTQPEDTPNVHEIDVIPGVEVETYYGCWLDINQPSQKWLPSIPPAGNFDGPFSGALLSMNDVIINAPHQCLIAEIHDDSTPIPPGQTSSQDKLAQRNIAWIDGPGSSGQRTAAQVNEPRNALINGVGNQLKSGVSKAAVPKPTTGADDVVPMPHPFEIHDSPVGASEPDELMVFWGNTPPDSTAAFYFPDIAAGDILSNAKALYPFQQLTSVDANTIKCVANGVTFVPIPHGANRQTGLLTVNLPPGTKRGQTFNIVVRQTSVFSAYIPPPPARGGSTQRIGSGTFTWRQTLGAFQFTLTTSAKQTLLLPEDRLLSWLLWKLKVVPPQNRWYPVLQRYAEQVSGRVLGLGGNPITILPSPTGTVKGGKTPPPKSPHHHHCSDSDSDSGCSDEDHHHHHHHSDKHKPKHHHKCTCKPKHHAKDKCKCKPNDHAGDNCTCTCTCTCSCNDKHHDQDHDSKDLTCHTGAVAGLVHDSAGRFEGFMLLSDAERRFVAPARDAQALVARAWEERRLLSVYVDEGEPREPRFFVLR